MVKTVEVDFVNLFRRNKNEEVTIYYNVLESARCRRERTAVNI